MFSMLFLVSSDFSVIVCVNFLHVPTVEPSLEKSQLFYNYENTEGLKVAYVTNVP